MYVKPPIQERWRRRVLGLRQNWLFYPSRWKRTVQRYWRRLKFIPALWRGELTVASASLSIVKITKDGRRVNYGVVSRKKVTRAFVKDLAAVLAATGGPLGTIDDYKYHASGTNSTAEANTDTALGTEAATRSAGTQTDTSAGATGNYQTVGTITYTSTLAIVEHGIFNAAAVGTLLDRSVFAAINVVSGDSIQFTYDLTITAEA